MKKIIVMIMLSSTVAYAKDTRRMDLADLNHFIPDCSRKSEQMAFLESQLPSRWEQQKDTLAMTSVGGTIWTMFDGTYDQRRNIHDRRTQAVVRSYMIDLDRCPTEIKPAGCVTVRDSTNAGASQGRRCYDGSNQNPVVDHWEPMVR